MRTILSLLFVFVVSDASSQEVKMQLPVQNGSITPVMEVEGRLINKTGGLLITSKNDSCFVTEDGIVTSTFNLGQEYATLIKTTGKLFVTYSHLSKVAIKRGDKVKKGSFIGLLGKQDEDNFELLYMLVDEKGYPLTREKHLEYIQSNAAR